MKNSLTAVIYLQPDQIFLRIIELPSLKVVNDVRSGLFAIGEDNKTANYRKNMAAITDNIEGFKELIIRLMILNSMEPMKIWIASPQVMLVIS